MKNVAIFEELQNQLQKQILILDGAMGTMIQQYQLSEKDFRGDRFRDHPKALQGNNDILSLTRPDIIEAIHLVYLEAGANIIETNTFSSTSIAQQDYKLDSKVVFDMNKASAKIAKETAKKFQKTTKRNIYVAGALGPTNRTASISPDVNEPAKRNITFEQLVEAYYEQVKALVIGGVDLILVETIFDTLNAKAAFFGITQFFEDKHITLPCIASGTITDMSGRTLSGQTLEAFMISLSHVPLLAIGLNCALGAKEMQPHIKILAEKANCYTSLYPNAGLPNEFGAYDQTPEEMGEELRPFLEKKWINIVGGCCGTTPEHIRCIADIAKTCKPRELEVTSLYNSSLAIKNKERIFSYSQ